MLPNFHLLFTKFFFVIFIGLEISFEYILGILGDPGIETTPSSEGGAAALSSNGFSEVTAVPVATAGPCYIPCNTIKPFMVLLFFMSSAVAISQMPLLMIVLR